ncbi:MAG: Fic family protein [uncultured Sulfurovum sp.]|uniref:Fic family protein n=1 Tax=uncultured Sulfurovum sp. TaxID=269237 RepID=A0A6S6SKN2_9BACT|nr:MAG: Fic family protein [uncultured Sulfurovum sp.]
MKTQTTTTQWIWHDSQYPHFTYDRDMLDPLMQKITLAQGELIAYLSVMDAHNIKQTQLNAMENEIMSSCAIEGEILNRDSVRSSIQEKLGLKESKHYRSAIKEDNYVDVLIDANTNYAEALSLEKIFVWHHAMFEKSNHLHKINIASFRDEGLMQVVSGAIGREKIYYEAPPRDGLELEMDAFITWYNHTPASLIKAAITHLWFVIIHPLDDGNGRIARALTDMVLSEMESSQLSKLYSMSKSINDGRKHYYSALEQTTGYVKKENHTDITLWCTWFFETLYAALLEAQESLTYVIDKTKFWDVHRDSHLNARQTKVINKILDMGRENFKGGLSRKKYIIIADTTSATASRDIADLLRKQCIKHVVCTKGRNVRYEIIIS